MTSLTPPSNPVRYPYRATAGVEPSRPKTAVRFDVRSYIMPRWIWLVLILGVAAGLRLHGLDREGYWGDEYLQVNSYRLPLQYTVWHAISRHGFGPPDFIIGWLAYRISPTVWMCRLPAALWGVASIWFCFLLGRRLFSWHAGLFAAAILTFCRLHLVLSQEARPYAICLAMMLATLLLLLRSFETPSLGRLLLYGAVAVIATTTRSFIPFVFMAVIVSALTLAVAIHRRPLKTCEPGNTTWHTLRRVWIATLIAGALSLAWIVALLSSLNALPGPLAFLRSGSQPSTPRFVQNVYELDLSWIAQITRNSWIAIHSLWSNLGFVVLGLALAGIACVIATRKRTSLPTRCVLFVMLTAGPAVTIAYAFVGGAHLFYDRYNFYLMPMAALFASYPLSLAVAWIARKLRSRRSLAMPGIVATICLAISYPVAATLTEAQSFRRIDWQGCAAYLKTRVTGDDVILTLTDAPFGRVQKRFFGKYEWPSEGRALCEAAWTLAISDSHFDRLGQRRGRIYAAVVREVPPQSEHLFHTTGLREPPAGFDLVKFRGLDLLVERAPQALLPRHTLAICDMLANLPLASPSTKVIPLTLKARMLARLGLPEQAQASYAAARSLVGPKQIELFEHATASWHH